MVDAVTARWHGDNYQARVFWENAFNLLLPNSCVIEVTFEADGPKSFDDVVVKYDPPVAGAGAERVSAEYHQVKWHVQTGGRFGYADFTDPKFIGAETFSLLERLQHPVRLQEVRRNRGPSGESEVLRDVPFIESIGLRAFNLAETTPTRFPSFGCPCTLGNPLEEP